jgi:6-pyruvoyltetrahydropterin/6-carboxytetrahydropterin synthase
MTAGRWSEPKRSVTCTREHEIACGHRVLGHEGKCKHLHGHNYLFRLTCHAAGLDALGRVIDFSVIKSTLCEWLEMEWDHRTLLWDRDPWQLERIDPTCVRVPFNPTAENIAEHVLRVVGPQMLPPEVTLCRVEVWETRKCSAVAEL